MNKFVIGIIAVVVVIAVAIGITLAVTHGTTTPTAIPSVTKSSTPTAEAAPTGCLGGSNRDNAMLLAAQKAAPHTTNGAVDFAAAFVRWTFRHPTATVDDANSVAGQVIASDASAGFKNLGDSVSKNQNPSGGAVADGSDFYVSTAPGVWYVDKQAEDAVTVSIGAGYVIGGAVNPQLRNASTFELEWQSGGWRIKDGLIAHTTEELFKNGTPFSGGC